VNAGKSVRDEREPDDLFGKDGSNVGQSVINCNSGNGMSEGGRERQ